MSVIQLSRRKALAVVGVLAVLAATATAAAWAAVVPAPAPYEVRFSVNAPGAITIGGNVAMTCAADDPTCADAQAGTATGAALNNNNHVMTPVRADTANPQLANSSAADLSWPAGARVLWAGLYWGARTDAGSGGEAATGDRTTLQFGKAGQPYFATAAEDIYEEPSTSGNVVYHAFDEVTDYVQAQGPGQYWAGDISAATGRDRYAGWSLVVVYEDTSEPVHNLTVFDGFARIASGAQQDITIEGFQAPPSGQVDADVHVVAYEGDRFATGDALSFNGQKLTTAQSGPKNFFNSTHDVLGTDPLTREPAYPNMLGFDIKEIQTTGLIQPGDTSATVRLETNQETYYPGVVATELDVLAPDFSTSRKSVVDLDGADPARPGDTLRYTLTYVNTGGDAAENAVATDAIPAGTTFRPGSLVVGSGPGTGALTDGDGDDLGEFTGDAVTVRLGTGADATTGGTLAPGASTSVQFDVVVGDAAVDTTVTNQGQLDYTPATLGEDVTFTGNLTETPVGPVADIAVTKAVDLGLVPVGEQVEFTVGVSNAGPSGAADVGLADTLPEGVSLVSATSDDPGVTCDDTPACELGTVPAGESRTITITARVDEQAEPGTRVNLAEVTTSTPESDDADNRAEARFDVDTVADLQLTKTVDPGDYTAGDEVVFTLVATNAGPSTAEAVEVVDTLPAGLTFVSAASDDPGVTCDDATPTCSLGDLADGESRTITVVATVDDDAPGGALENTATVSSATPEFNSVDNTATDDLRIAATVDIAVEKTIEPVTTSPGGEVTATLVVTNNGPGAAEAVSLTDVVPAGFTITVTDDAGGSCEVGTVDVRCELGALAPGDTSTLTLTYGVPDAAEPGEWTQPASVFTTSREPDTSNNAAADTFEIVGSADLVVTKEHDVDEVDPGGEVIATITVANAGPSPAVGATLLDTPPEGVTASVVEAPDDPEGDPGPYTDADAECAVEGGSISCELGDLAVGEQRLVVVGMIIDANAPAGERVNHVEVSSTTDDPDPESDTADDTFTVTGDEPPEPTPSPTPTATTSPSPSPSPTPSPTPSDTPEPTPSGSTSPPTGGDDGGDGGGNPELPDTGAGGWLLALVGAVLVAAGVSARAGSAARLRRSS